MTRPMEAFDQRVVSADLEVCPEPAQRRQIHDLSGASVTVTRFEGRTEALSFTLRAEIDHRPELCASPQDDDAALGVEGFAYDPGDQPALGPYLRPIDDPDDPDVAAWAARFLKPVGRTRVATVLSDMTHAIRENMAYELRLTGKPQGAAETLARGRGSCRDYAVLLAAAARRLGVAARFTSGYVYSCARERTAVGGGHTHAWVRAYLPAVGWCDFDPTNGLVGAHGLVRVVAVAHPRDAVPLHGTWSGFASDFLGLEVDVALHAQDETATQPLSDQGVAQRRH